MRVGIGAAILGAAARSVPPVSTTGCSWQSWAALWPPVAATTSSTTMGTSSSSVAATSLTMGLSSSSLPVAATLSTSLGFGAASTSGGGTSSTLASPRQARSNVTGAALSRHAAYGGGIATLRGDESVSGSGAASTDFARSISASSADFATEAANSLSRALLASSASRAW